MKTLLPKSKAFEFFKAILLSSALLFALDTDDIATKVVWIDLRR